MQFQKQVLWSKTKIPTTAMILANNKNAKQNSLEQPNKKMKKRVKSEGRGRPFICFQSILPLQITYKTNQWKNKN